MNVRIVYGTTEGHTGKICRYLQEQAQAYVEPHSVQLGAYPSAFLSVSLAALDVRGIEMIRPRTEQFLTEAGWKPGWIEYATEALKYSEYDFFKRFTMWPAVKWLIPEGADTTKDHEFTDWAELRKFVVRIVR